MLVSTCIDQTIWKFHTFYIIARSNVHLTNNGGGAPFTLSVVQYRPSSTTITCKKKASETAFEETKQGFVDYDHGQHEVFSLRKEDIPHRTRL